MPTKKLTTPKEHLVVMVKTCPCCGFRTNDGVLFRSIVDLHEGLRTMSADTFNYHVNAERNDFLGWIDETLELKDLARSLSKTRTQKTFSKKIEEHLAKQK